MQNQKLLPLLIATSLSVPSFALAAPPSYSITPISLMDAQHTRSSDGARGAGVAGINNSGQVAGVSLRFDTSTSADLGSDAWVYNGTNTVQIGLVGSTYTRADGYRNSSVAKIGANGYVSGTSGEVGSAARISRWGYVTSSVVQSWVPQVGQSAWIYNGSQTTRIGLYGENATSSASYNEITMMNDVGMVVGRAARVSSGNVDLGNSAWFYNGSNTVQVGLLNGVFTRADGYRDSLARYLNNAGQVLGTSTAYMSGNTYSRTWLYNGTATVAIGLTDSTNPFYQWANGLNQAGQAIGETHRIDGDFRGSAWLYNGSSTVDIGLHGSEHIRADGYSYSSASKLNEAGQVIGATKRFNGANDMGASAWLHSGGSTSEIGLVDNAHTRSDGYRSNSPVALSQNGQVIGNANRYDGGAATGQSAWLYNGASASEIGLIDSIHAKADGTRNNTAVLLNNAGKAAGTADRYDGPNQGQIVVSVLNTPVVQGQKTSAWAFNGNESVAIGVQGQDLNSVQAMNEAGQIIGSSKKIFALADQSNYGVDVSETAWLYDMSHNQTYDLTLSSRSDGFTSSHANYLGENGAVLGSYTLFGANDAALGTHLFYFSEKDGVWDLGSLLSNLDQADWTSLGNSVATNGIDKFVGVGLFQGHSAAYLMSPAAPAVPLPASVWLFGSSLLGMIGAKRKFQAKH